MPIDERQRSTVRRVGARPRPGRPPSPEDGDSPVGPGERFASNLTFSLVRRDMIYVVNNAAEIGGRDRNEEHLSVKVVVSEMDGIGREDG